MGARSETEYKELLEGLMEEKEELDELLSDNSKKPGWEHYRNRLEEVKVGIQFCRWVLGIDHEPPITPENDD